MSTQLMAHEDCAYQTALKASLTNVNSYSTSVIDKTKNQNKFEEINNRIIDLYKSEIESMGINFHLQNQWQSNNKNAAALKLANDWSIQMNGGIYKDSAITDDAQALGTCHELGHLIGGAPYKSNVPGSKMSSEGQADFWASAVCFKRYTKTYPITQVMTDLKVKQICEENYRKNPLGHVGDCYRSMKASESLSTFFANLVNEKKPEFNDQKGIPVISTHSGHPNAQCRLETFKAGYLCEIDEVVSKNLQNNIQEMNCQEQNSLVNKRPSCWFNENFYSWKISNSRVNSKESLINIKMANNRSGEYKIKINLLSEESSLSGNEVTYSSNASMQAKDFNFIVKHANKHFKDKELKYSIEVFFNDIKIHNEIVNKN